MCGPHSENHWSKCFHPAHGQGARLTFSQVSLWARALVCSSPGQFELSFLGLLHRRMGPSWPVLKGHQDLKMTATGSETSSGPLLAFWRAHEIQEIEAYILGKPQTSEASLWTADSSSQAPHTPSSTRGHLAVTCESLHSPLCLSPSPLCLMTFTGEGENLG